MAGLRHDLHKHTVWWWLMSQKTIAIFTYKQWLLSIDMKTKVVQHVPRINISNFNFELFQFSWFPLFVWCSNILFNVHPILTAHRNFRDLILVSIPRFVSIRNNLRPFSNTPDLPEWPKWPIFLNVVSNLCQSIAISALSSTVGCIDSLLFCQSLQ